MKHYDFEITRLDSIYEFKLKIAIFDQQLLKFA